jgi:phage antirepressor YoqD-like protein
MNDLTNEKTMTIKEIAYALNVTERFIQLKVKELFPDIVKNGLTTYLNEMQIAIIKNQIEKNPHLERSFEVENDTAMALKLYEAGEYFKNKYEEIKKENEVLKPKAIIYDDFIEINDLHSMADSAKIIDCGIGRNKLFQFLRDSKILKSDNTPYQSQIDNGYFKIKIKVNTDIEKNIPVTYVTPKGIEYIKKLLNQFKKIYIKG